VKASARPETARIKCRLTNRAQSAPADLVLLTAQGFSMIRHFLSLIVTGCLLSDCASHSPVNGAIGWNAYYRAVAKPVRHKPHVHHVATEIRSKPDPNIENEKALADLRPHSADWWAMRDQINAEEQRSLTAKLLICRGCLPTTEDPGERTGSTNPPKEK
jgi:hypothetical protein